MIWEVGVSLYCSMRETMIGDAGTGMLQVNVQGQDEVQKVTMKRQDAARTPRQSQTPIMGDYQWPFVASVQFLPNGRCIRKFMVISLFRY